MYVDTRHDLCLIRHVRHSGYLCIRHNVCNLYVAEGKKKKKLIQDMACVVCHYTWSPLGLPLHPAQRCVLQCVAVCVAVRVAVCVAMCVAVYIET